MKQVSVLVFCILLGAASLKSQVTIGSLTQPKATLDVVASKTNGTTAEGIIAPRLTLAQLKSADSMYVAAQKGAMVYVTDVADGTTAKTVKITAIGYYYFDGAVWQPFTPAAPNAWLTTGNAGTNPATSFLGTTDNYDLPVITNNTEKMRITAGGNVGVGTTAPVAKFEVNGAAANTSAYNAGSGTAIDFTQSNLAYTTASAGAFTVTGLKDGGTYTLAVKGATAGTAAFTQSGITFHYCNNDNTTAGTQTLFTLVVMGSDAYVWMTSGF